MKMRFMVTVNVNVQELKEWHEGVETDERPDTVRQDIEDAVENALGYASEIVVSEKEGA
jgi:hypothetical protein